MSLMDLAKDLVRDQVAKLKPDADIMPMLLTMGKRGQAIMVIPGLPDEAAKDKAADMIAANLAVATADEAVFISAAWMVKSDDAPDGQIDVMPSQHPQKREVVFLAYSTREDGCFAQSELMRTLNVEPLLTPWEEGPAGTVMAGRFGDAIRHGMRLAGLLEQDPEMMELLDEAWERNEQSNLMNGAAMLFGRNSA